MFRSFQPFLNPIGFGASDYIEFALAITLVGAILCWPMIEAGARRLALRPLWCGLLIAALPVALRLILLPWRAAPSPTLYDEFSHLLVADTLSHFRLANPVHPLHQFFETFFVLQQPSYSSIYSIGQGAALALGRALFGHSWAGVALSMGAFCGLCYWMLRGWMTPVWAMAGGFVAAIGFGALSPWMNSYWGGGVAALAGCLVFGALPRLRNEHRWRHAVLLAVGLGIHALTRPYETIFLTLSVVLFFVPDPRSGLRAMPIVAATLVPFAAVLLMHNYQVTGSVLTLPQALSQFQYGVPTTFTVQDNPTPHRELTPQQELGYKMQVAYHGNSPETFDRYFRRLLFRVRQYGFFLVAPLYLGLVAFVVRTRQWLYAWVVLTLLLFSLGSNFYPFFFPHYIAAVSSLFVLASVAGVACWRRPAAQLILVLCVIYFVFWYGVSAFAGEQPRGRRAMVTDQLTASPGRQLVFVRYTPQHIFQDEWVYNDADIDAARVVWARDLGTAENEKLRGRYSDRTAWLLEPDSRPPRLSPYEPEPPPPQQPAQQPSPPVRPAKPVLRFEEVK